jgi:hypothetical protein
MVPKCSPSIRRHQCVAVMTEVQCATCGLVAPVTLAPGLPGSKDIAVIGIDGVGHCQAHPTPTLCHHFQSAIEAAIGIGRLIPHECG